MKTRIATLQKAALLGACLIVLPVYAQYKVVGPDGRVTYTDTPRSATNAKPLRLGERESAAAAATLPFELHQAATRYPVTLYTSRNCAPCDSGRQLLRQRGVPFSEKLIVTAADLEALERTIGGGRQAPVLTIGSQTLQGLTPDAWNSYLDSAGYPRESKLPAGYQYPAATPLTEPPAPVARQAPAPARSEPEPRPEPNADPATGIRF